MSRDKSIALPGLTMLMSAMTIMCGVLLDIQLQKSGSQLNKTKLSIVIPVSSLVPNSVPQRLEVLQLAIKYFYKDVDVIVVEQSLDGEFYFLKKLDGAKLIPTKHPVFNKSWCVNVGVKAATNDYVAICDSDMFSRDVYWGNLLGWMKEHSHEWAFGWDRLNRTTSIQRDLIVAGRHVPNMPYIQPVPGYHEGGVFVIKKSFFYKVGQFNECMTELGGIDNSIAIRCRFLYDYYPMYPFLIYHMWHQQTPKKRRPTRLKNIKILKKEKARTQEAISWLVAQRQGNLKAPLSDRETFLNEGDVCA